MQLIKILHNFIKNKQYQKQNKHDWAWTNHVYFYEYENKNYYIRLKNNFLNPYEPLLFNHYFTADHYYDPINHNLISVALATDKNNIVDDWYLNHLFTFLVDLENNEIVDIIAQKMYFDFQEYINIVPSNKFKDKFLSLYEEFKRSLTLVLSHNDLSIFNIITNKRTNLFQVIDFELAAYSFKYYDLFNFIRSIEDINQQHLVLNVIKSKYLFNDSFIYSYMFFVNYFAYTWAVYQTKIGHKSFIKPYIKHTENQYEYWYYKIKL
ncbi:phosphotransferase [Ureaplasma sp. ES3154-GEN]|uniref:phosphotransferase n=1 Tax=Ureaplasma sp. ES3154-GEN TaxID=2984844 RepID=UPI0021E9184D|nr:phosphotransferase [Ureaplasma sp. ES3154-GEN]MCV3743866.1 phosphotransferase [Ureaplasma sp. ES3154-GEN]